MLPKFSQKKILKKSVLSKRAKHPKSWHKAVDGTLRKYTTTIEQKLKEI